MFTTVTIPKQYKDETLLREYVDKYRELRLKSLKTDPDSFLSTFASESKQPFKFWTERITALGVRHLVAVQLNGDLSATSITENLHAVLETEWVGTLVLLGPKDIASDDKSSLARGRLAEDNAEAKSESTAASYHLAGFYVAPETRGQGLGKSLVDRAMEAISQDRQKMHNTGAICTVAASHKNIVVRRLFKTMGFLEVTEEIYNTTDGDDFIGIVLRREFWP